jgi:hypothetical protein
MDSEKLANQLRLAAEIIKHNHPWEFKLDIHTCFHTAINNDIINVLRQSGEIRPILVQPPKGKLHNPCNLTAEEVGVGNRLLAEGEIIPRGYEWYHCVSNKWTKEYNYIAVGNPIGKDYNHSTCVRVPLSTLWFSNVDPYKELKEAHAKGEIIQLNLGGLAIPNWHNVSNPEWTEPVEKYRIKPWEMPKPPEGKQWHRNDFTKEMLDGGYRPALLNEIQQKGDEYLDPAFGWLIAGYESKAQEKHLHRRTKRPLPVDQPFGPEDVPPNSLIRMINADNINWFAVVVNGKDGINTHSQFVSWSNLMKNWQILTPGETTWKPCKK